MVVAAAVAATALGGVAQATPPYPSSRPDNLTHLYVAARGAGAVGVYRSDSSGNARPERVLPLDGACGPTDVWGVAPGPRGEVFTQSYLGESCTRVVTPDGRPVRSFRSFDRDSPSIAVGADGTTYVARLQPPEIEIFAPDTSGQVVPARVLTVDGMPRSLTVDPAGELVVAVQSRPAGNALEVFAPDAAGAATPLRRITGPHTGLGTSQEFFGNDEQVVVTSSPLTHRLYAAVTGAPADPQAGVPGLPTHIAVFPETATGDAAPLRTIAGSRTGLDATTLTGTANNPASGNIWVMATQGGLGSPTSTGRVLDFNRLADGNATPVRSFTDATTHFADVQSIAFNTR